MFAFDVVLKEGTEISRLPIMNNETPIIFGCSRHCSELVIQGHIMIILKTSESNPEVQ
jgi:hypothetical protein